MSKTDSYRDLIVYKKAYMLAMEIFEFSKMFPEEEKFSLTDQIRRSSRSVTSCLAESWVPRRYVKSFVNKLIDSLGEEYETDTCLDDSKDCKYLSEDVHQKIINEYYEVCKMLISMINNPDKWCP